MELMERHTGNNNNNNRNVRTWWWIEQPTPARQQRASEWATRKETQIENGKNEKF